jgi:hypothetical protein
MHASFDASSNLLIHKLESITDLSDEERQALMNLPMTARPPQLEFGHFAGL